MTIHRFFIAEPVIANKQITLPGEISHQITKVLRLHPQEKIVVFDKTAREHEITLTVIDYRETMGIVENIQQNTAESETKVVLYQALIPREKFEDVLEKTTEIGVSTFVPLETARTLVRKKDVDEKKQNRWQKIIQEATEQSERGVLPSLLEPLSFFEAIQQAAQQGKALIAWERGEDMQSSLDTFSQEKQTISIFIGPEGGFTKEEIAFAKDNGITPVTLGKRILRSETAAVVFASLVLYGR